MRIEKHPILGEPNKGRLVNFELMGKHLKDMKENQ